MVARAACCDAPRQLAVARSLDGDPGEHRKPLLLLLLLLLLRVCWLRSPGLQSKQLLLRRLALGLHCLQCAGLVICAAGDVRDIGLVAVWHCNRREWTVLLCKACGLAACALPRKAFSACL